MRFRTWFLCWLSVAVTIPAIFIVEAQIHGGITEWPLLALILWPSSLYLMMSECVTCSWVQIWLVVPGVSIGANVLLYGILGTITWPLTGLMRRRRECARGVRR